MPISGRTQTVALIFIFLGMAGLQLFGSPFIAQVIFMMLCISWSAWCFISVFRGQDEVEAASARYALAFASSIGVPISIVSVVLMSSVPAIQNAISRVATLEGHDLNPAATGFGLGVVFTTIVLCISFSVGLTVWWASKR